MWLSMLFSSCCAERQRRRNLCSVARGRSLALAMMGREGARGASNSPVPPAPLASKDLSIRSSSKEVGSKPRHALVPAAGQNRASQPAGNGGRIEEASRSRSAGKKREAAEYPRADKKLKKEDRRDTKKRDRGMEGSSQGRSSFERKNQKLLERAVCEESVRFVSERIC